MKPTGNRIRGSYQYQGGIGSTNVYLKPGDAYPETLFAGIDRGFYLKVVFGLHAGVDSVSGDFSLPAAGFLIENGEISTPVRGISIAGNVFEFLKSINVVANDLTWQQGTGCPTIAAPHIVIGGI